LVLAAVVVGAAAGLTGGLHLDGLADLFDAVGGGKGDRARILEILRDSRIGAHGAAALVLVLLAKVGALAPLVERQDLLPILIAPAIARWAVTPLVTLFPYARVEGLGRAFNGGAGRREVAVASALMLLLIATFGLRFVLPALAALAVSIGIGVWIHRRLGGLTGDVYGAAIELAETTALSLGAGHLTG
jgi:adenosylcobinamide-GDP ribazoletransferase